MRLCCFFNYAPLYRQSIYKKIDGIFDTQFYFGEEVIDGQKSGIAKLDYSIFKNKPIESKNKIFFKKFLWCTKAAFLGFKKYDTYLVTGHFSYSYIPLILTCKFLGKRIYGWGHGLKSNNGKTRILNNFLYKNLTGFFVYGEKGKERLVSLGFNKTKIHVIYNSLTGRVTNIIDYSSDVLRNHFNNDNPVLIFVGRLMPQKKLEWLIEAHAYLQKKGIPSNLVLVGTGPQEATLKQIALENGYNERIWFFGECYDDNKLSELLYNSDLCVSPGNIGLTALHSLQYGTPALSHGNFELQGPEYETIVEGETGTLYKEGDKVDFMRTIENWLVNKTGDRNSIRQNCYAMINGKWNSDNQIRIFKEVFEGNAE